MDNRSADVIAKLISVRRTPSIVQILSSSELACPYRPAKILLFSMRTNKMLAKQSGRLVSLKWSSYDYYSVLITFFLAENDN